MNTDEHGSSWVKSNGLRSNAHDQDRNDPCDGTPVVHQTGRLNSPLLYLFLCLSVFVCVPSMDRDRDLAGEGDFKHRSQSLARVRFDASVMRLDNLINNRQP